MLARMEFGNEYWAANDFSVATLAGYDYIYSSRLYYSPNWPNNTWEGNLMTVFAFSGGTPGSITIIAEATNRRARPLPP